MPTTDLWNQPASTDSRDAVQAYERAVLATLEYRSSANDHVKAALEADPEFALAHCFKGYQYLLLGTEGTVAKARQAAEAAKARHDRLNDRERGHVAALASWAEGDVAGAANVWQRIVRATRWPRRRRRSRSFRRSCRAFAASAAWRALATVPSVPSSRYW